MIYDADAGYIETPGGPGRFIEYDGTTKTVTVEMDNWCRVIYPASLCFIAKEA